MLGSKLEFSEHVPGASAVPSKQAHSPVSETEYFCPVILWVLANSSENGC